MLFHSWICCRIPTVLLLLCPPDAVALSNFQNQNKNFINIPHDILATHCSCVKKQNSNLCCSSKKFFWSPWFHFQHHDLTVSAPKICHDSALKQNQTSFRNFYFSLDVIFFVFFLHHCNWHKNEKYPSAPTSVQQNIDRHTSSNAMSFWHADTCVFLKEKVGTLQPK